MPVVHDFTGKVAIVTGGTNGIGRAIVEQLSVAGAAVVNADINRQGEALAEQMRQQGRNVHFMPVNVCESEQTNQLVDEVERRFGTIDVLVNNAGIFPRHEFLEMTTEQWDRVFDVNVKGVFHMCQSTVKVMRKQQRGAIVNIGSLNARVGAPNLLAYSASKAAIVTMTRNLTRTLARDNIRINCVHPGWVVTEGEKEIRKDEPNWMEKAAQAMPLGRLQQPEDVARMVVYVASDDADQVTGQEIAVSGGMEVR